MYIAYNICTFPSPRCEAPSVAPYPPPGARTPSLRLPLPARSCTTALNGAATCPICIRDNELKINAMKLET